METGRFRGSLSELYQCVHSVKKIFFRKNTYHIFNLLFLILMAHGSCELHVQFLQFARLFGIFTVQVLWLGGVFGQILTKRSHKSFELFKLWFPVIQSIESTCKFGLKLIIFITSKILRSNPGISRIFGLNSGILFYFFILDYSKTQDINLYWCQLRPKYALNFHLQCLKSILVDFFLWGLLSIFWQLAKQLLNLLIGWFSLLLAILNCRLIILLKNIFKNGKFK